MLLCVCADRQTYSTFSLMALNCYITIIYTLIPCIFFAMRWSGGLTVNAVDLDSWSSFVLNVVFI